VTEVLHKCYLEEFLVETEKRVGGVLNLPHLHRPRLGSALVTVVQVHLNGVTDVLHKCCTTVTQMPSKRYINVTQALHKCNTNSTHVVHKGDLSVVHRLASVLRRSQSKTEVTITSPTNLCESERLWCQLVMVMVSASNDCGASE
jgi:hypothetical protein